MDKLELIKRNTEEVINEKDIPELLKKKKPVAYCGYETSGPITLGHLVTITKLLDLQKAGFHIKVLFAESILRAYLQIFYHYRQYILFVCHLDI